MFGRILISLISCFFWLLRAIFAFFWASYLNLPTSRNLHTGGSALGDTSTRSSPTSAACSIASRVYITPRFSPSSSITRTLGTVMNSLKRGPLVGGGGVIIRSEEHTSELQSLMRISYAVFCLKKKIDNQYY